MPAISHHDPAEKDYLLMLICTCPLSIQIHALNSHLKSAQEFQNFASYSWSEILQELHHIDTMRTASPK